MAPHADHSQQPPRHQRNAGRQGQHSGRRNSGAAHARGKGGETERNRTKQGSNKRHFHDHDLSTSANNNNNSNKKPRSSPSTTIPLKNVDVVPFAVSRARELDTLRTRLTPRAGRVQRVYQQLSWHARRRTMSHTSRRTPLRLRGRHARELAGQNIKPNKIGIRKMKKYRKQFRFLKAIRKLRMKKNLETHIWHAKRFHMTQLHGTNMKVASFCNDRGLRSMTRCLNQHCIAHDHSYLAAIQITQCTKEFAKSILHPSDFLKISIHLRNNHVSQTKNANRLFQWVLLCDDVDGGIGVPIAPADIVVQDNKWSTLWLWVRPEVSEHVLKFIQDKLERTDSLMSDSNNSSTQAQLVANKPLRFSLYGPKAESVLNAILSFDGAQVSELPSSKCVKEGIIYDHGVHYMHECNHPHAAEKPPATVTGHKIWDGDVREYYEETFLHPKPRNQYPRMTKVRVPVVVMQHGNATRGEPYGWDVLLPKGWGIPLWMAIMTRVRSRAIGLHELDEIRSYRPGGPPLFPHDFLDCTAVRAVQDATDTAEVQKELRRPRNKQRECKLTVMQLVTQRHSLVEGDVRIARSRTEVMSIPGALVNVMVRVRGRGIPKKRGLVALPSDDRDKDRVKDKDKDQNKDGEGEDERNVVGVIIMGGYAMGHGHGIGRALVSTNALRKMVGASGNGRERFDFEIDCFFRNREVNCEWRKATLRILLPK